VSVARSGARLIRRLEGGYSDVILMLARECSIDKLAKAERLDLFLRAIGLGVRAGSLGP
jgi:hypothetical protein